MIEQIYNYFTIDMLYMWVNIGVLPLWFLIVFFPQSNLCKYLAVSIFPILLLGGAYVFVLYKAYLISFDFDRNFSLYLGFENISELFSNEYFLVLFWIHFLSINLFTGGWILSDAQKFSINRIILAVPLIIVYLVGPIGLFIYWFIRIFYAKKISLFD